MVVRDYKLDSLYQQSQTDFATYLQGFLKRSIPKFTNCSKSLGYVISPTPQFNENLSLLEQVILADWMVINWLEKEVNDVTQFNLHLNDTDFKHYSEAQNLKEKRERLNDMREKLNQDMVDYGFQNIDWSALS